MKHSFKLAILFIVIYISCSNREKIYIVATESNTIEAGTDLVNYLAKTYPKKLFSLSEQEVKGEKNILLDLSPNGTGNNEAFKISGEGKTLKISGKTPLAINHGVYGLLKKLGWNFYLSFEVPPSNPVPLDFNRISVQNEPLKKKRIIFDWHNFLSGCTGWDYEQWKDWIDNASKIGFNTIMVHAYGNNPMQSFSMNGEEKELGYLTTSLKGRDWGAQHVNDVQRMVGSELFTDYEYGSKAAKVPDSERSKAATTLMQKVFQHASQKSMGVCFAIDVDTWMANPQNVINTLPKEALLKIGGYNTANPEHPEGRKYYKAQLTKLLGDYPEITMLAAWMRMPSKNPGQGSIWLTYDSAKLPEKWRKEYFEILKQHPELKDERPYPGIFAISKIVKVYREILNEIRPDIELVLGSWRLYYPRQADPFIPDYCGFIPLDWEVVFGREDVLNELAEVGKNRKLYPIVWAQHDDHRYAGRPYKTWADFNSKLNKANAAGYGIIHWTTHPLDLYFSNTENQVWKNTENETPETACKNFASSLMKKDDENLVHYYSEWFNNAPMFGRETSDFFMRPDEEYRLDGYDSAVEVVEKAKERLELLKRVNTENLNPAGLKEFNYQLGMESFIISFFENHRHIFNAIQLLKSGKREKAGAEIEKSNPEETVGIFAKTIGNYSATRGEKGILLPLNLRWLPDFIDVRQQTGLEPVHINFQPTLHDPLAQGAGHFTFFIDSEKNFWLSLGEKELGVSAATNGKLPLSKITDSWITFEKPLDIPLKTMRNHRLSAGEYELNLIFDGVNTLATVEIFEDKSKIATVSGDKIRFTTKGGNVSLKITPHEQKINLAGLVLRGRPLLRE